MDARLLSPEAIVFDVGNVLLRFDVDQVCALLPDATRAALKQAMFGSPHRWSAFDLGAESNEQIARRIAQAADLPDCWGQVIDVLAHFHELLTPMPLVALLPELRALGKRLYALTNYPEPSFSLALAAFPFLQEMDGILVSSREKLVKPDPKIFRLLARRFSLVPGRTLFIDDSLANVQAAAHEGFQVWHYAESPEL